MWTVITVCFITFTSILGITEILRRLWLFLMCPKEAPLSAMVVYLKEDIAIQQLRYALEFISWERRGDFSYLAVVTEKLSEKTFSQVEKIVKNRNDVILFADLK